MNPYVQYPIWPQYGGYSNQVPNMGEAVTRNDLVYPKASTNPTNQAPAVMPAPGIMPKEQKPPMPDVNSMYQNYISQFNQSSPAASNLLKEQYNWYDAFSNSAKNITGLYNNFYTQTDPYYTNFAKINEGLNQDVVWKLQSGLDTAYSQYWPDGDQTRRVAQYYSDMANNIAAQNAVNIGTTNAGAIASWANAGAVRNATSKVALDANTQFLNLKQKEIENYDNIYKNLNAYIDNFTSKYANSQDKYVRDTYNQLVNYKTQIAQAYLNSLTALDQAKLQDQLQKWMLSYQKNLMATPATAIASTPVAVPVVDKSIPNPAYASVYTPPK